MAALRYGIVGGGFVAGFHIRALDSVRRVEVAGLTSRTPPLHLAELVQRMGLGEGVVYGSVEELTSNVDVVLLLGPNFARVANMEAVARAVDGGATLRAIGCEKPLARNLGEARKLVALAAEAGAPTVFFENQLHLPVVKASRVQLAAIAEAMGPPVLARASEEHSGPHSAWFWDPVLQGGGVLSDMGCHSMALGRHVLTPHGRPVDHLVVESVSADVALLKWGQPRWRQELLRRHGVDYAKTPAEDFATGVITYRDPDNDRRSKAQFTVSWMYDMQGLRLSVDGLGPGYGFAVNSLRSPLEVFVGDAAAAGVSDAELALEKSTASRGLMAVNPNEPDAYGYVDEHRDLVAALEEGRPPLLDWSYGLGVVQLTMAAYLSAERGAVVDMTDPGTVAELETYVPLIQQGRGAEVLPVPG